MTSSGFTLSQLAILQRVIGEGPTTAASLAAVEHVSQQSIAQSVATLKAADLVQTERDATDGRKIRISATESGHKFFQSLMASRKAWLAQAIDTMIGPNERQSLDITVAMLELLAGADLGPVNPQ
jgi:DNA-binding MarR family transcriptional regulator